MKILLIRQMEQYTMYQALRLLHDLMLNKGSLKRGGQMKNLKDYYYEKAERCAKLAERVA